MGCAPSVPAFENVIRADVWNNHEITVTRAGRVCMQRSPAEKYSQSFVYSRKRTRSSRSPVWNQPEHISIAFLTTSLPLFLRSFILWKCLNCELSDSIMVRFSFKSGETFTFTQRLINIYTLHCLSFIFFRRPPLLRLFLPSPFWCHHDLLSSPGSQLSGAYYSVCHTLTWFAQVCAKRVLTRTPKKTQNMTADSSRSRDYWRGVSAPISLKDLNTGAGRRGNNLMWRSNRRKSAIKWQKTFLLLLSAKPQELFWSF